MIYIDKALSIAPEYANAKFNKALDFYLLGDLSDADVRYTKFR